MRIALERQAWTLDPPFAIAGKVSTAIETVHVRVTDDEGRVGRAETAGVSYLNDHPAGVVEAIEAVRDQFAGGVTRAELQSLLPRGGARNGLDCALWDLACARTGTPVHAAAGLPALRPIETAFTIGLSSPEEARASALAKREHRLIKIKVDGDDHIERIEAVRAARPDATLIVDANQSWDAALLAELEARLVDADIAVLEQPLAMNADAGLDGYDGPLTLMADESCQDRDDLEVVRQRYGAVNIKLDKTGGLTEALELARAARATGLKLMVGNMCGSSLAMAPAFLVAQLCDFADLDGPLLQTEDVAPGLVYREGRVAPPEGGGLWGGL